MARIARAERRRGSCDLDLQQAGRLGGRRRREQGQEVGVLVDDEAALRLAQPGDAARGDRRCCGEILARRELGTGALGEAQEFGRAIHVPSS